jgi:hypothetical protein
MNKLIKPPIEKINMFTQTPPPTVEKEIEPQLHMSKSKSGFVSFEQ